MTTFLQILESGKVREMSKDDIIKNANLHGYAYLGDYWSGGVVLIFDSQKYDHQIHYDYTWSYVLCEA